MKTLFSCEPSQGAEPWWSDAVVYEIYLRSFADSDGDGIGDLAGVNDHLDHLVELGVDAIWLTPFFPSPGYDHGYDVSDFTAVDPVFGNAASFESIIQSAHSHDIRVLVDVVPNHTSNQHPWFLASLDRHPNNVYRDYYLWRDPAADGGPPNNWRSNFGGPAWTLDAESGQYYHHSYLPEQPDLNWRNEHVYDEWVRILKFWLRKGVDGFRIDVAHNLVKHAEFPDNPPAKNSGTEENLPVGRVREARGLERLYDIDQDEVIEIYRRLRAELPTTSAGESPFLLGETVLESPERVARYIASGRLDSAMWFGTQSMHFDADDLANAIEVAMRPTGGRLAWFLSNHDRSRPASRLGGQSERGADRALATAAVILTMPGPYLLYQGEELGAMDLEVYAADSKDPIAVRGGETDMARDRARAPMPWADVPGRGFSSNPSWLPHGPLPPAGSVAAQQRNVDSHLHRWRRLIATWGRYRAGLPREVAITTNGPVLSVRRGTLHVIGNFGKEPMSIADHVERAAVVIWRSLPSDAANLSPEHVRAEEVVWLYCNEQENGQ